MTRSRTCSVSTKKIETATPLHFLNLFFRDCRRQIRTSSARQNRSIRPTSPAVGVIVPCSAVLMRHRALMVDELRRPLEFLPPRTADLLRFLYCPFHVPVFVHRFQPCHIPLEVGVDAVDRLLLLRLPFRAAQYLGVGRSRVGLPRTTCLPFAPSGPPPVLLPPQGLAALWRISLPPLDAAMSRSSEVAHRLHCHTYVLGRYQRPAV